MKLLRLISRERFSVLNVVTAGLVVPFLMNGRWAEAVLLFFIGIVVTIIATTVAEEWE